MSTIIKSKIIKGTIKNSTNVPTALKVNTCVYVPQFKFHTCTIKTCKNYTDVTATHCLAIDRVQPLGNKIISDAELHMFKFNADGVTSRLVSLKRKKAIYRVKAILILNQFIEFIKSNYKSNGLAFNGKSVEKAELSYPLKIRKLKFQNWMWEYLVDQKVYAKFTKQKEGECGLFKIYMLLNLTALKFKTLISQIQPNRRKSNEYKTTSRNHSRRT
jgi:hypothetical protein